MRTHLLVAAAALLTLTACSDAADRPTTAPSAEPVPAQVDGFVAVVRARVPEMTLDHRDEEITAAGQQACASLAAGAAARDIVAEAGTLGADAATARRLIRLAIEAVCPEQRRRAGEF